MRVMSQSLDPLARMHAMTKIDVKSACPGGRGVSADVGSSPGRASPGWRSETRQMHDMISQAANVSEVSK
jgi:hypothetical protein